MFVKTFLAFLLIGLSCTSAHKKGEAASQDQPGSSPNTAKYRKIAEEKYKDHIDYIFNESKTHVLCVRINKSTPKIPESAFSFFVYDLKNDRIIFEDSIADGSVHWTSDHLLEVEQKSGTVSKENPIRSKRYGYDVVTQKKIEISN